MNEKEYIDLLNEDYANVLIHMVCLNTKKDGTYSLVFGFVEFFPMECAGAPVETEWQSLSLLNHRLFYRRKKMSVKEGIDFYLNTYTENPFIFTWEGNENNIKTGDLHPDSAFTAPYLSNYSKLPFIPFLWGVARVHSLFPADNSTLVDILCYRKIADWLEERLCFDLVEKNPELIGSMHCCLPNPLYRSCGIRLIPGDAATPPRVQIHFTPREEREKELQKLTVCLLEKRLYGYAGGTQITVSGEYSEINLSGGDEKVGSVVHCPQRGLLGYSEFNNFVRELHVNIFAQEETIKYIINNEITNKQSTVCVEKKQAVSEFVCGLDRFADTPAHDPGKRIRKTLFDKEVRKQAHDLGQFLCKSPESSKSYVTEILNRALSTVIIIDPYFDPEGLIHYIKSIQLKHIVPEVIVSAEALKQEFKKQDKRGAIRQASEREEASSQDDTDAKNPFFSNADIFEKLLKEEHFNDALTLSVMPGMGVFHDRFLITDNQVWFSGNSLNSLGNRLSIIIRLPDGSEILEALENLRDGKLKPFAEWLAEHRQAKG